jgi:acetyl esterase/lipase
MSNEGAPGVVDVVIDDAVVDGRHGSVPVRRYAPTAPAGAPLVWVHGGSFSGGDLDMPESDAVARAIAATGRTVIAVDYQRVPPWSWWRAPRPGTLPGVRYPLPVDDVADAFESVARTHPGPVLLGGASAGACLAAAAALRQTRHGDAVPAALVLAYGTFHAALPPATPELRQRLRGRHSIVQFRRGTVDKMNRNYAGSLAAMRDPIAFPGGHDLRGMPPTLILDADRDSLRASGEHFAQELAAAHVTVTHHVVQDSTHGFLNTPDTPPFQAGVQQIITWLENRKP